ncbi:dioxygenase-like protein [Kineococcus xinjiangensis]|uniref:Dioxygenase-like protein n=1 Tax=Kineococcus xinjiangensis TaxID=512762 RepID=A0A2S6IVY9_9ACTN|nr:hypothetical protein [Kineococcus xinjiangensis]PPK98321.1 dioxygenase-like protein [Kineococcus xinjiangensis]
MTETSRAAPQEELRPHPGGGFNGANILDRSGVVRSDIRPSLGTSTTTEGVPMTLTLHIVDMAGGDVPFEGAAVYVWHCDRDGNYSPYSEGGEDENHLRGVQVADAKGSDTFTSTFPACYSGRWSHIHFEVCPDVNSITDATSAIATSQVALPEDVCEAVYATSGYGLSVATLSEVTLSGDNVFGNDAGASQLGTVTGDVTSGYAVTLTVGVDTTTTPTAGSAPAGGPAGAGVPGGRPPSGAAPDGPPPTARPASAWVGRRLRRPRPVPGAAPRRRSGRRRGQPGLCCHRPPHLPLIQFRRHLGERSLVISLGGGHLLLPLRAPTLLAHEHDYVILEAERLTRVVTPYGGGDPHSASWGDAHLRLTWNPDRAMQDWGPRGPVEDPR